MAISAYKGIAAVLVAGLSLAVSPVQAREVFHGYVKDSYYLSRGGTPASLEEVANDPMNVFRSEVAYDTLRAHVSEYLGRTLTDSDFRTLLRSDAVRLTSCIGTVDTSGVTNSGRFGWHKRACYKNEMLIELRLDDGRWVVVASQGCYNPVRGRVPAPPPPPIMPPPPTQIDYHVKGSSSEFHLQGIYLGGVAVQLGCPGHDCCIEYVFVPGLFIGGFNTPTYRPHTHE